MSIVLDILEELSRSTIRYKGAHVNLFGIPRLSSYKYESLKSGISRLKRGQYIAKSDSGWFLTPKGKKYLAKKLSKHFTLGICTYSPFNSSIHWKSDWKGKYIVTDFLIKTFS